MTALALTMTTAGLNKFTAAQGGADIDLTIATVGVTAASFIVAPTLTVIPGEIKRLTTISGEALPNSIVHMTMRDLTTDAYTVRGFGLYLADGTLFAVYGQADPILEKSAVSTTLLALDIKFPTPNVSVITFGDANFAYPPASEAMKGVAEIATQAEVNAGTDDERLVTPLKLAGRLAGISTDVSGRVPIGRVVATSGLATGGGDLSADRTIAVPKASGAEAIAGTSDTKAVTPLALAAAIAAAIAALVNSSPGTLDTLNELAAALGNDPNFATTVAGQIATKAPAARQVTGGGLATGGGDLTADRTISVAAAVLVDLAAGTSTSKAVTPKALADWIASFAVSAANPGYVRIPGTPIILQWGRFTASANGTTPVTFPLAFPSSCFSVVVDGGSGSGVDSKDNLPGVVASTISATGFSVFSADDSADGCCFLAVGA